MIGRVGMLAGGSELSAEGLMEKGLLEFVEGGEFAGLHTGQPFALGPKAAESFNNTGLLTQRRNPASAARSVSRASRYFRNSSQDDCSV